MAMRSPDRPFIAAAFQGSTLTQVSTVGTDVIEDSVIFTTGSNNSNNGDDLLGMCNIVEETECGPVWAMICFNTIGGLIVSLNIMHVLAVMATPQIRKSANAKGLFNLAAADLIYGCTIIISYNCPFTKLTRLRKYLPLCATLFASTTGLLALSGGTLVLMSMERCIIICVPFVNRQKTNKVFKTLLTMFWVIDFSCCFGLTWKNLQDQLAGTTDLFCFYGMGACGLRWSGDGLYQGIAMYGTVITFILTMLFANIAIIIRVQKSKKFRTKAAGAVSSRNIKTAQIVGVMCLCYSFCWCCIFLWLGFRILKPEYVRPWHSHLSLMIVTSNSMMNPLIYGLASPEYRSTIRNIFIRGWRKAVDMAVASADLTSSDNHDRRDVGDFVNPNPRPSTSSDTRFEKEVVSERSATDCRGVTDKPDYQREVVNNKGCDELTLTTGITSKANPDITAPVKEHESVVCDSTAVAAKEGSVNNNLDLAIELQEPVNDMLTTEDDSENLKCNNIDGVYNIEYHVDITINSTDETTTL